MRCKHQNIEIIEYITASTWHKRIGDRKWLHDSDVGDYTGTIYVKCPDCGLERVHGRKSRPKWLREMIRDFNPFEGVKEAGDAVGIGGDCVADSVSILVRKGQLNDDAI